MREWTSGLKAEAQRDGRRALSAGPHERWSRVPDRRSSRPRERRLVEVATELFRARGFHATSMEDLARAVGMNRGSLYHYIEAKDDLLWEIVDGAMADLDAAVRPILSGSGPARDRLEEAIATHLAVAADAADALSILQIELRSLPPDRRAALIARRDAYEALWRRAISDGINEGAFRTVDVRLAGIAILSACNWFTQWFDPAGPLSVAEIAERFADIFLAGLAAESWAGSPAAGWSTPAAEPAVESATGFEAGGPEVGR